MVSHVHLTLKLHWKSAKIFDARKLEFHATTRRRYLTACEETDGWTEKHEQDMKPGNSKSYGNIIAMQFLIRSTNNY